MEERLVVDSGTATARRLKGHAAPILCCVAFAGSASTVASGGEDGRVCIFDLRSSEPTQIYRSFEGLPVASLCFNPGNENFMYAAAGSSVYSFDLRLGSSAKELVKYMFNTDDINQVTVNRKATFLASSDDSGETKILDLQNRKIFKTLRGGHANICSAVQFHPQRPWEVITGGLDSKIIKWDFNRGRQLAVANLGLTEDASSQVCNPPFVHALACPDGEPASGEFGRVLAVARGDFGIDVYNLNSPIIKGRKDAPQTLDRKCHLDGHTAAVSHVTFARFEDPKKVLVSGGNDSCIKIWDWTSSDQPLKLTLNHNKKVNWLASRSSSAENLIVADTSKRLSIYSIPC